VLPPPRSFSQGATSFVASRCQGIHQMPLPIAREPLDPHASTHTRRNMGTALIRTHTVGDRCQMSDVGGREDPARDIDASASSQTRCSIRQSPPRLLRRRKPAASTAAKTLFTLSKNQMSKDGCGMSDTALEHRNSFSFRSPRRPVTLGRHRLAPLLRHCPLTWWSRSESNRRPPECKSGALPTELRPRYQRSDAAGFQISEEAL
jgi:hypothetical protein